MFLSLAAKRALAPSVVVFTRGFFVLCLSLLMSCGGGGGGGDNGGNNNFRVTLDRNSVSWTFYAGADVPPAQTITGTATGTFNGQLFVAAVVENNGAVNAINPNITISLSGTQATASVQPVAGLAAGAYTGRILFLACSDAACNNRIGGTPLPVNFTVTVQAGVQATPGAITRSVESGNTVVADVAVAPGVNETGFTIGATSTFVQITNQTAGGFRVTLPSLPVGVYNASIPLTGSNGSRSSVPITYTVTAPPGGQQLLSVTPSNVTLTAAEGASSAPSAVQVTEATWRPGLRAPVIEYREGQNWLNIAPVQGGYNFVANAASLSSGTYTAIVFIANNELPQGINEPFGNSQQVFVSVTVGPGFIRPADIVSVVDAETWDFELIGDVSINLAGGSPVTWNATSDVPWLLVTPSGPTGPNSNLQFGIQQLWLSTAENFADHVATVTVTAPGTAITPVSFAVRVQRRMAEVTGVGAHVQLSGQQTMLVVSGRGFGAFDSPNSRLSTNSGSTATFVERVSDTKMLLTYDSFNTPGTFRMIATNRLGYETAEGSFVVVSPTAYTYDTVATGGAIAHLAIDHETGTLYGVRLGDTPEEGSLVRFRSSGGNWTADSPSISAVGNVGVLNDGNVIVNTLPGGLTILDRDTLNSTFTVELGCTGLHHKSLNMPVTLDGRVWLSRALINEPTCSGSPRWGEMGWFDPQTEAFQLFETPNEPWFVGRFANGPSFVMSRNGERMVMHQESNQNFPPMVYLDASESVLRPTPQDQPNWFQTATSSDDGGRMLFDHDRLVNEEFATVGRVEIPAYSLPFTDAAFAAASVLSPDGSRAYVLTYPVSFLGQPTTPSSPLPRVWVLDTSGDVGDAALPVEGYFELADAPSCLQSGCDFRSRAAISLDGGTLFFAGDQQLVVAPIPSVLTTSVVVETNGRMQTKAKPWRLPQH